ncbi:MAG: iron-sulfur cluster repair di-iron protein [Planctomycetes bacterium]|nr:iron-sulfur cluster repair di-iron protein [Planctomycetota bacterium]
MTTNIATLDIDSTVSEWVIRKPSHARVFEKYAIDYCCGGKKTLRAACAKNQIDPREVFRELQIREEVSAGPDDKDWSRATLSQLADHIEQTHHAWLKRELPRLRVLVEKVNHAHGARHRQLEELQAVFLRFAAEMGAHMQKEEQILFPLIRRREAGAAGGMPLEQPIAMMEHEHDEHARSLAKIRELTGNFTPPADACNTFRAMLDTLRELDADIRPHIHKENNILFPRAMAAARSE